MAACVVVISRSAALEELELELDWCRRRRASSHFPPTATSSNFPPSTTPRTSSSFDIHRFAVAASLLTRSVKLTQLRSLNHQVRTHVCPLIALRPWDPGSLLPVSHPPQQPSQLARDSSVVAVELSSSCRQHMCLRRFVKKLSPYLPVTRLISVLAHPRFLTQHHRCAHFSFWHHADCTSHIASLAFRANLTVCV
jgi:hypothetical protein